MYNTKSFLFVLFVTFANIAASEATSADDNYSEVQRIYQDLPDKSDLTQIIEYIRTWHLSYSDIDFIYSELKNAIIFKMDEVKEDKEIFEEYFLTEIEKMPYDYDIEVGGLAQQAEKNAAQIMNSQPKRKRVTEYTAAQLLIESFDKDLLHNVSKKEQVVLKKVVPEMLAKGCFSPEQLSILREVPYLRQLLASYIEYQCRSVSKPNDIKEKVIDHLKIFRVTLADFLFIKEFIKQHPEFEQEISSLPEFAEIDLWQLEGHPGEKGGLAKMFSRLTKDGVAKFLEYEYEERGYIIPEDQLSRDIQMGLVRYHDPLTALSPLERAKIVEYLKEHRDEYEKYKDFFVTISWLNILHKPLIQDLKGIMELSRINNLLHSDVEFKEREEVEKRPQLPLELTAQIAAHIILGFISSNNIILESDRQLITRFKLSNQDYIEPIDKALENMQFINAERIRMRQEHDPYMSLDAILP